mmetsp:Transcript_41883/g.104563  ORF Transcript_41883/g.104563 Transcript_41883/m.104563 type:complete len:260 (-) Transcript_41883:814-1593(-)
MDGKKAGGHCRQTAWEEQPVREDRSDRQTDRQTERQTAGRGSYCVCRRTNPMGCRTWTCTYGGEREPHPPHPSMHPSIHREGGRLYLPKGGNKKRGRSDLSSALLSVCLSVVSLEFCRWMHVCVGCEGVGVPVVATREVALSRGLGVKVGCASVCMVRVCHRWMDGCSHAFLGIKPPRRSAEDQPCTQPQPTQTISKPAMHTDAPTQTTHKKNKKTQSTHPGRLTWMSGWVCVCVPVCGAIGGRLDGYSSPTKTWTQAH